MKKKKMDVAGGCCRDEAGEARKGRKRQSSFFLPPVVPSNHLGSFLKIPEPGTHHTEVGPRQGCV